MDIDKLIESFSAISELINSPDLRRQLKQDAELGKKIKKLQTLVEEIKVQHGDISFSRDDLSLKLKEVDALLSHLGEHCETNLVKLDFLKNLKPLN